MFSLNNKISYFVLFYFVDVNQSMEASPEKKRTLLALKTGTAS